VLKYQGKKTNKLVKWEERLSAEKIKKALNDLYAEFLPRGYFRLPAIEKEIEIISKAFSVNLSTKVWDVTSLKKLKNSFTPS
jgi:hypothetical protein